MTGSLLPLRRTAASIRSITPRHISRFIGVCLATTPATGVLGLSYLRILSIVGIVLIATLSLVPGDLQIRTGMPKTVEHFGAYLGVSFILVLGRSSIAYAVAAAVLLSGFSFLMEVFQEFIPGRTGELRDAAASSAGAFTGAIAANLLTGTRALHRVARLALDYRLRK
jgi:VanZ family protein